MNSPYSPPTAVVADPPDAVVDKPKAIFVLQVAAVFFALLCGYGAVRGAWQLGSSTSYDISTVAFAVSLGLRLVVTALLIWMLIALQRRSQVGRWLAVLSLGGMILVTFWISGLQVTAPGMSTGYVVGTYFGVFLILTPFALLLYLSAFSKKARAYFAKRPAEPARS